MVLFVIPLKAKAVSEDWSGVCEMLSHTLRSIYNQSDGDFRVVLACHDIPELSLDLDERYEVISISEPPPPPGEHDLGMEDKFLKLRYCMVRAGALKPEYVMIVDADDVIHRDLVKTVNAQKHPNGWILKAGYNYAWRSRWIEYVPHFNCGTNAIIASSRVCFPEDVSDEERDRCILLTCGHTIIESSMKKQGYALEAFPFPAATYIHSHGDNQSRLGEFSGVMHWKLVLKSCLKKRWLSKKYRDAFALPTP